MTHETTWQDIAQGYRHILVMLIENLSSTMGEIAFLPVVHAMESVDTQAELLAEKEQVEEYTDELTGVRLTVKHDHPEHPLITVNCGEHNTLSVEQVNAALRRLRDRAGIPVAEFPDPVVRARY